MSFFFPPVFLFQSFLLYCPHLDLDRDELSRKTDLLLCHIAAPSVPPTPDISGFEKCGR